MFSLVGSEKFMISSKPAEIVISCKDIETMDVYVDGEKMDTHGEFTDTGTETCFTLDGYAACIRAESSGNRHKGLVHVLVIGNTVLEPVPEVIT
ncbi:Fas apoptotic inhibitory molecule 1 [Geodia barretti]|uniref:Fas apoptotic inhibitory molecule 1 n=2 Tax=Geodia barretti TaxID=519541 RepID=A0AA35R8L8_GEOBA|nr:Fas apoptotic inhibitory molecule 1 [Geodia barretti]